MFTKILVPLDRSSLAEQALGQAAAIARESHAGMDVVLVEQPLPFAGFEAPPWGDNEPARDDTYLENIVDELKTGAGVEATHAVMHGIAVEMIGIRAKDVGADLIVMTSHGRSGLSRTWLGSVADGVVRRSEIPVLVLRPQKGKTAKIAARHLFKRILVPLDGSTLSEEVLSSAVALAKATGARLSLLSVVQPLPAIMLDVGLPVWYPPLTEDPDNTKRRVALAEADLAEVAKRLVADGVTLVDANVIVADQIAQAILDFARGNGVDAIAMATHGRGASRLFMGSVADKVLRASGLPVLLQRPASVPAQATPTTKHEAPELVTA